MSVTFDSAIDSLQSMFPEWDKEALKSILISNQGRVESTIEMILSFQASASGATSGHSGMNSVSHGIESRPTTGIMMDSTNDNDDEAISPLQQSQNISSSIPSNHKRPVRSGYRGIKCDLPSDFLTLPNKKSTTSSRILADEELALMLQNELFQKELMERGYYRNTGAGTGTPRMPFWDSAPRNHSPGSSPSSSSSSQPIPDMGIMKSLSSMGEAAKRNLSALALRFNAAMESQTNPESKTKEHEMKPLVGGNDDDDDDEDEVISFEDTSSEGRGHFLNGYDSHRDKNYWTSNPAAVKKDS